MRYVSIMGDSISTYKGYNPNGYAVFYDKEKQRKNGLNSVYDTWWAKVNQALHAYLCVNNSYSGSKVTGKDFPSAASEERVANLHNGEHYPDVILFYIGINDFGSGVQISGKKLLYVKESFQFFDYAYEKMLSRVSKRYPQSKIICGTLMRSKIEETDYWGFPEAYAGIELEQYNNVIRKTCKKKKCYLADLSSLNMRYETLDGTHPTKRGHLTIAKGWITCLKNMNMIDIVNIS